MIVLQPEEKVLIKNTSQFSEEYNLTKKFLLLYEGPYIIENQAGPNYIII